MNRKKVAPPSYDECRQYLAQYDPKLQLGEFIKAGGAGVVYNLEGTSYDQVIKFIDTRFMADRAGNSASDKDLRRRCYRYIRTEIDLMKRLHDCAHVMPLLGEYTYLNPEGSDPSSYISVTMIIMPKMCSLMQYIKAQNPLTESDILQLGLDMAEALCACEVQKIMHRDLKPDNIFVIRKNGKLRFVLGDFGVSRRIEKLGAEKSTRIGTDYYIAPEIRNGDPLCYLNSDIYSLGVTLFYLMTNHYPELKKNPRTSRTNVAAWHHVMQEFMPILEKALQIDPEHRYHSPTEMLADLSKLRITRHRNVIREPFTTAAKEALCHGKEKDALEIAMEGYLNKEHSCRRLLAYCLYRKNPHDERILDLLDESFYEDDPTGILIRGMILAARGDLYNAGQDIRDAANNQKQCIPAWYYYGRFLYEGNCPGIPKDTQLGLLFLQKAAEQNFYPALRVMKRIREQRPSLALPDELQELLKRNYSRDDPLERADIIKFL